VSIEIQPGQYLSPSSVASGGVAFDPEGAGNTTVAASIPSVITTTAGSVDVEVTEAVGATNTLSNEQAGNDGGSGGGAFDPYWLVMGMLYLVMTYRRRRRIHNQR
jgi:hypothetical protein